MKLELEIRTECITVHIHTLRQEDDTRKDALIVTNEITVHTLWFHTITMLLHIRHADSHMRKTT